MSTVQRYLSEYLQCELYHSIGAYRVTAKRLEELQDRLAEEAPRPPQDGRPDGGSNRCELLDVVRIAAAYNGDLAWHRHASTPEMGPASAERDGCPPGAESRAMRPRRDPIPRELPLSREDRFDPASEQQIALHERRQPWKPQRDWMMPLRFYGAVIESLEAACKPGEPRKDADELLRNGPYAGTSPGEINEDWMGVARVTLGESVLAPREGLRRFDGAAKDARPSRRDRYEERLRVAGAVLLPEVVRPEQGETGASAGNEATRTEREGEQTTVKQTRGTALPAAKETIVEIVCGHLGAGHDALPLFVVAAQAEAHLSMHAVEAWQSMCVGERAEKLGSGEREWLVKELDRCIALNTFAHCVSRTAPWIFAADDEERSQIVTNFHSAWEHVRPSRGMWIASQIGLLALHRRGYAWMLRGERDAAYNDFHKLHRLIRDTERRVLEAPAHVDGAAEFLAGLAAQAHHHIGELYRVEHAHRPALKHFEAASHRIDLLEREGKMEEVLVNSRWHVRLQVSRGKAAYEMGQHKEALSWHLHAWRRLLKLLAADTGMEANTEKIELALEWLERVKYEPELRKPEVSQYVGPVVAQLDRVTVSRRIGALAAEVLLRLGHLLFVLNVGFDFDPPSNDGNPDEVTPTERERARRRVAGTLALPCLRKAAECDPHSTLAAADLLKAVFKFNYLFHGPLPPAYREELLRPVPDRPLFDHWPHGGNDYERLTRIAEYLHLAARKERFEQTPSLRGSRQDVEGFLARDLLLDFFVHTDSTNVRKSQIHRLLLKRGNPGPLPGDDGEAAIEFTCMRRYSSAYPMLPRPSAFRALGGGYFVRLHGCKRASSGEQPYGIAIDPGMDFVENLYRTGYSIGDIDMIVLTHDHVDHVGSLDPLFSLLHVRTKLVSQEEQGDISGADGGRDGDGDGGGHGGGDDDGDQGAGAAGLRQVKILASWSVIKRYEDSVKLTGGVHLDPWQEPRKPSKGTFAFYCFEGQEEGQQRPANTQRMLEEEIAPFKLLTMSSAEPVPADGASRRRSAAAAGASGHRDLSGRPSHGVCIRCENGPSIAFTSDTPAPPSSSERRRLALWREKWAPALAADVLVAHLSSVPLTELRRMDPVKPRDPDSPEISRLSEEALGLNETVRPALEQADPGLRAQIEYAQWLCSGTGGPTATLVGRVPADWRPPHDHPFLTGLVKWAREYRIARGADGGQVGRGGLFVVGELSEELGTMRGKVADRLNDLVFCVSSRARALAPTPPPGKQEQAELARQSRPGALTGDIGLRVCIHREQGRDGADVRAGRSAVKVLCTTCNLDNDRAARERYHHPERIHQVCVKGENEGMFYNCDEHDPAAQEDPTFLEQLERFDIFGR